MLYSLDLRKKVLRFIEAGGSKSSACRVFAISCSTIYNWLKLKEESGSLDRRPLNRSHRKICPEILKARVNNNPDALLSEHAKFFGVRIQSIIVNYRIYRTY